MVTSTETTQLSPAMPDPVYSVCSASAWLPCAILRVSRLIPIQGMLMERFAERIQVWR